MIKINLLEVKEEKSVADEVDEFLFRFADVKFWSGFWVGVLVTYCVMKWFVLVQ